jgi:hypothetical protein
MPDEMNRALSVQSANQPVPLASGADTPPAPRRRSAFRVLVSVARVAVVAYVVGWVLSIAVATILGRLVPASAAERLDGVLRAVYTSIPLVWGLVSFVARVFYYGLLDLRIFGPSPTSELFARSELLAMVMATVALVVAASLAGVIVVRSRVGGRHDA